MNSSRMADLVPCALIFIDGQANGSPNFKSKNPLSYVRQAICLNKCLLHAGLPRLNVFTNALDLTQSQLADTPQRERPIIHELRQTMEVPERARFYATPFKLDLLAQAAASLHNPLRRKRSSDPAVRNVRCQMQTLEPVRIRAWL